MLAASTPYPVAKAFGAGWLCKIKVSDAAEVDGFLFRYLAHSNVACCSP